MSCAGLHSCSQAALTIVFVLVRRDRMPTIEYPSSTSRISEVVDRMHAHRLATAKTGMTLVRLVTYAARARLVEQSFWQLAGLVVAVVVGVLIFVEASSHAAPRLAV
jgi:hypothetical protein